MRYLINVIILLLSIIICSCNRGKSLQVEQATRVIESIKNEFNLDSLNYVVYDFNEEENSCFLEYNGVFPSSIVSTLSTDFDNELTEEKCLTECANISSHLMKPGISGFIADIEISNNYSVAYVDNIENLLGWHTFVFDNQLVLWNCFQFEGRELLLLNFLNKSLFVGISYNSRNIPSVFQSSNTDLLLSPFATAILSKIYCNHKILPSEYVNGFKSGSSCKYPFLEARFLESQAATYQLAGNIKTANQLETLYDGKYHHSISSEFRYKQPVAAIDYVRNNASITREFELKRDTSLKLFTVGQTINEIWPTDKVYGRDFINLHIRSRESNRPLFRSKFYYKYPFLNGSKVRKWTYPYQFRETKEGKYLFEVCLKLNHKDVIKRFGNHIDFQLEINDSDDNPRVSEALIAVSDKLKELSFVSFKGGKLKQPYSVFITDSVIPDGVQDSIWSITGWQPIQHLFWGEIESKIDLSARFKSVWNGTSLWFLVEVTDQCKTIPWIQSTDYCRIVNSETGELVWRVEGEKGKYFPFYKTAQSFQLPKGKYTMEYISDDRLSFSDWEQEKLPYGFYGAYLYYDKNNNTNEMD